jgi:hypothetical protein
MNGIQAAGGARLCGQGRQGGELYLVSGLTSGGSAIETLLMDLPMQVDAEEMGISAIGIQTFMDPDGITHVLDWVGEASYPEVADFVEEARIKGISRKISHTAPIEGLSSDSRLYLLHPRAVVTNAADLPTPDRFACPCGHGHRAQEGCIGLAWHAKENAGPGTSARTLAQGRTYPVNPRLEGQPEYALGVFMVAPITALTVIQHPDADIQAKQEARARSSALPVFVSPE